MSAKSPNEIDKIIGARIRHLRIAVGMSQERLGERLGITFQQIQKYEKGSNRVNASRLQAIAQLLGVPISYFFPDDTKLHVSHSEATLDVLLNDPECLEIATAFRRIENPALRRALLQLAKAANPQNQCVLAQD